jgi:hypothetical protein
VVLACLKVWEAVCLVVWEKLEEVAEEEGIGELVGLMVFKSGREWWYGKGWWLLIFGIGTGEVM